AKYLNECTQEKYIPIYVLVSGVFSVFMALLTCLPCGQKDNSALKCLYSVWHILVSSFLFCWFIA
ncbi:calpain-5-like isoform X1, partial [Clarias magur]